jgi:uncharacterized phage protein (TIGR02218 family)
VIPIGAALKAHLEQQYQTTCTIWKVTFAEGSSRAGEVIGFTDFDQDIDGNDIPSVTATDGSTITGGGDVTYLAASGYTRTDIATASDLSVDNLEVDGALVSPSITESDLHAGVWDFAEIEISIVNWAALSQGRMILRVGHLGEVTVERNAFKAELRGLMQAYSRIIGELTSPMCRNNLGNARCQVDLVPFTFDFTVDGVDQANQTFTSSELVQSGPAGGVTLVSVTKADPGVCTISPGLTTISSGDAVTISGALGMTAINGSTLFRNPNAGGTTFDLGVDTSSYPTYTASSGTVTPQGAESGYFDFGLVTWLTGNNAGLQMEVRSYVPGQVTLQLPMAYAMQAGDTGTIVAGCDKAGPTCTNKFSNMINFRGERYLPGQDRMMQVGKQP